MDEIIIGSGEVLFAQNDIEKSLIYIIKGEINIVYERDEKKFPIGKFKAGDFIS